MGLTSAMLVGFTGIKSNQVSIDTIGDNVANVNTTGFKNQRTMFETMFYRTLDAGSPPGQPLGGTNPIQIGYGSGVATVQRSFTQGSLQLTGVPSDLAVDGDGFFITTNSVGDQIFTRDGSFTLDTQNVLVTSTGDPVLGFGADTDGTIVPGTLTNLTIPLGVESAAQATSSVVMEGNLDAAASPATTPGIATSTPLNTATGVADAGTSLTDLVDASGTALFAAGDVITIESVQKGGIDLPPAAFVVGTDGSTLGDFAAFLESSLAIQGNGSGSGVVVGDGTTGPQGALVITSNLGQVNALSLDASSIRNSTSGALLTSFTSTPADGEGATTGFVVFDSLGNPVNVRVRTVMESMGANGNVWRFYAESADFDSPGQLLGTGTITFDQNGQFVSATDTTVNLDRSAAGAVSPLGVNLDFSRVNGLADNADDSVLVMSTQDGTPAGTMIAYGIDDEGVITGAYSNGQSQVLGQVALATFANPEGLLAASGNRFFVGPNSGAPVVLTPGTGGSGSIQVGALESSNVDLSREFIGLITASTGFSAAGRVVRTADEMLQELLLLAR